MAAISVINFTDEEWSENATKLLLRVILEKNVMKLFKNKRNKRADIFKMIENELKNCGIVNKNTEHINNRWKDLTKMYRHTVKTNEGIKSRGGIPITCYYYNELDKILDVRHIHSNTTRSLLPNSTTASLQNPTRESLPNTIETNFKSTPVQPQTITKSEPNKCGEIIYVDGQLNYFCFFCQHNENNSQKFEDHLYSNHLIDLENESSLKSNDDNNSTYQENDINFLSAAPQEAFVFEIIEIKEEFKDCPEIIQTQNNETEVFPCDFCGVNFTTRNRLIYHNTLSKDYKFNCIECNVRICGRYRYAVHNNKYHRKKKLYKNSSKKLNKDSSKMLNTDSSKKKILPIRSYICYICKIEFKSTKNLKIHMRKHTGERPYQCTDCVKAFYIKSDLSSHIRQYHTFERPYMCTECGACFPFQRRLNNHIKCRHRWQEESPLPCPICSKILRNKERLRIHLKIHTNEKPFKCNICNKLFKIRSGYKQHMDIHSGKRRFPCKFCDLRFAQSAGRRGHVRRVHEGIK